MPEWHVFAHRGYVDATTDLVHAPSHDPVADGYEAV